MEPERITVSDVNLRMDRGEKLFFVDSRSPASWSSSSVKIPGSVRITAEDMINHLDEMPHDLTIITYCT
jgi:rhodanese-related sulfurtransferase